MAGSYVGVGGKGGVPHGTEYLGLEMGEVFWLDAREGDVRISIGQIN